MTLTPELSELAERMDRLEDELEAEREERRRLEDELEEERERRRELEHALEDVPDLLEDRTPEDVEGTNLTDVWLAGQPLGKLLESTRDRLEDLEKRLEGEEAEEAATLAEDAPPIYRLLQTPAEALEPTERRTRFLWADLSDYASRTPKGYVLPASDARRVLNAAEPEDSDADRITSKQVGRVFHLSVALTREAAFIREKDGERQLVVPSNWEEEARAAAPDSAVS